LIAPGEKGGEGISSPMRSFPGGEVRGGKGGRRETFQRKMRCTVPKAARGREELAGLARFTYPISARAKGRVQGKRGEVRDLLLLAHGNPWRRKERGGGLGKKGKSRKRMPQRSLVHGPLAFFFRDAEKREKRGREKAERGRRDRRRVRITC